MQATGNTILITGGGSGIGRGLAESFHRLGNRVIISGRRKEAMEETVSANPGMESIALDIQNAAEVGAFAEQITGRYPTLNVLVNNAGIMRAENLRAEPVDLSDAEAIVTTNLLGPIRLTAALLPSLKNQSRATVMNVSSGLAFVPRTDTPTYCATKSAIHSYTQSLRWQLRGTTVEVLELIPPYVATDLMDGRNDPRAMPLDCFIAEAMEIITRDPTPAEICVEHVKRLRYAAENGTYSQVFQGMNGGRSES